ncbi:MAG: type II secretion system protein [Oxalobacter sp.]|nr:MAG: type II secretion system protein [Oxalobacter sp.]
MCAKLHRSRQVGTTLIELILFIVIVSVGVAGILSVMNITTRYSADPMVRKQALAIAESLLEEIMLQPFTFCDPTDPNAATAASAADCTPALVQGIGATAGQTRYAEPRFNNVGDYHGFSMIGIQRLEDGAAIGGLGAYNANVAITAETLGAPAADCLRIAVTVTAPAAESITLDGYRCRYAPRAVP